MRSKKAQAAMEYLLTYGWALLVIGAAIAALWFLLPKGGESCVADAGFTCVAQAQAGSNGDLTVFFKLDNQNPKDIEIYEAICEFPPGTQGEQKDYTTNNNPTVVASGTSFKEDSGISCGNNVKDGDQVKGVVRVKYNFVDDINKDVRREVQLKFSTTAFSQAPDSTSGSTSGGSQPPTAGGASGSGGTQ